MQPTLQDASLLQKKWNPHTEGMRSSALAGAFTGGAFLTYFRKLSFLALIRIELRVVSIDGPKRFLGGAVTAALACGGLQLAFNELSLLRIFLLARKENAAQVSDLFPTINMDMGGWSPVRRIPDAEYKSKLELKAKKLQEGIAEIEEEIVQLELEQRSASKS